MNLDPNKKFLKKEQVEIEGHAKEIINELEHAKTIFDGRVL